MIKVKPKLILLVQSVLLPVLMQPVAVLADCGESMLSVVSVEYYVNDEYAARMQEAPGKPEGVRGIETRQLIVTQNQSYEREMGRFWRLDEETSLRKLKEFTEKLKAGEVVSAMPKEEYHLVQEDKVIITNPNRYIYYDNIEKKGFERERDDPAEFLSDPEARNFLKDFITKQALNSDAHFAGKKQVLGKECQVVKASTPFKAEVCFFEYGIHSIILEEKINIFDEHVYTQQATKLDLTACVPQEIFVAPDWMSVS